jgi:predicted nucleic acid-binding protein
MERCVDASVAVKWALDSETNRSEAMALLRESAEGSVRLIAPHIFTAETDSVIRKHAYKGNLLPDQAIVAYHLLDAAPVEIVDHPDLRQRARAIAEQFNQRFVYDSLYAALADLRDCEFWTADAQFHKAVHPALPFVHLLGEAMSQPGIQLRP